MDNAFKDPGYKEARELVNDGKSVRVTAEDLIDYDNVLGIEKATEGYKREPIFVQVDSIEDLRMLAKYVNRIGLTITKVEDVENN